jgi:hypothetical protein
MEFVSCETGQSLQLIHMDEVRPLRGGVFLPDLAAKIAARYRFQTTPTKFEANQPTKFEIGVRELDGVTITIISLEIYVDGIIINSRNTDDADAILTDFIGWIAEKLKLREPKTWLPRRYHSRIVVDLERSAGDTFINEFAALSKIVSKALGSERNLEVAQLTVGPNPPGDVPYLHTWLFQPRIGQPYAPNRYFSAAPLSTRAHFDMLCELEAAAIFRR